MAQVRTRRRLAPAERRAEIVRAAHGVLDGRDASAVTFEEIAMAAGVSRALVYNYFGDRGGLLAAVYLDLLAPLDDAVRAALAAEPSRRGRARALVEETVEFALADPRSWRTAVSLANSGHDEVRHARAARTARLVAEWGDDAEAKLEIVGVLGLLDAAVTGWLDDPELAKERFVSILGDLVWSGVAHRNAGGDGAPAPS